MKYNDEDIIIETEDEDRDAPEPRGHVRILGMSLGAIFALLYVIGSFVFDGMWGRLWVIVLLAPVIDSLTEAIITRKPSRFSMMTLLIFVYLTLGLFIHIWHPTWLVFLIYPIWQCVVNKVKLFEIK